MEHFKRETEMYNLICAKLDQAFRSGAYGINDAAEIINCVTGLTTFFNSSAMEVMSRFIHAQYPQQQDPEPQEFEQHWGQEEIDTTSIQAIQQPFEPQIQPHQQPGVETENIPGTNQKIANPKR